MEPFRLSWPMAIMPGLISPLIEIRNSNGHFIIPLCVIINYRDRTCRFLIKFQVNLILFAYKY